MFVCNVKINRNTLFKIFLVIVAILIFTLGGIACYRVLRETVSARAGSDMPNTPEIANLNANNYTNVLKSVHDDLDTYVGQKIRFTGYVYRVYDLKENQFVLARNMIISSDFQTVVVGFLCDYDKSKDFSDGTWVDVTATIQKGDYHGEIPILKVKEIKTSEKPNDEYVYPPDDSYIPTSVIY